MTRALLVIDFQRYVDDAFWDVPGVLGRVRSLVAEARAAGAPVVWIQHYDDGMPLGSPAWELHPGLDPAEGEPVVQKAYRDAFAGTGLDAVLRGAGATELVLTGAQSDYCVRTALQSAASLGYDVTLVQDGHTTCAAELDGLPAIPARQVVAQTNANLASVEYPTATVRVRPAAEVSFA